MHTIYKMNADDLNADFIESLKTLFKHKQIEIRVHETDDTELEERRQLLEAETLEALAVYQRGGLAAQNSHEVITELRAGLADN